MRKREADKVAVGEILRQRHTVIVFKVTKIQTQHPDPRARVPLFFGDGQETGISYLLCQKEH